MLAFTDSIEAAQNRVTDAVDQWALWANGAEAMKDFYNILAYVIRNLDTFGITIGGLLLALNAKSVLNTVAGGIGKAGSATIGFTNKVDNFMSNLSTKGIGTTMADTIYGALETSYLESVKEKYTNALMKATESLNKENQARAVNLTKLLMEGDETDNLLANMVRENEILIQKVKVDGQYVTRLVTADGSIKKLLTVEEQQRLAKILQNTTTDKQIQEALKNIATSKNLNLSQEQLTTMANALKEAYKNEILELSTGTSGAYRSETANGNLKKGLGAGLATGAGAIISSMQGAYLGNKIGSAFGEDGQIAGTMIGGVLADTAAPVLAKGLGKLLPSLLGKVGLSGAGAVLGTALGGPFGAALLMILPTIGTAIYDIINARSKQALEDAANEFQEEADKFSTYTNQLNNVTTFDKYIEGVDRLGRNVSLTDDEYQKWLDSSNALAEVFPELVQYTDDQGNKIVGLNGSVASLTDTLNEYIDAQQRAADQDLLDDILFKSNYENAKSQYDSAKEQLDMAQKTKDLLENTRADYYNENSLTASYKTDANSKQIQKIISAINAAEIEGVYAYYDSNSPDHFQVQGTINQINEAFEKAKEALDNNIVDFSAKVDDATGLLSDEVSAIFREMEYDSEYSELFDGMTDEVKQALQLAMSNFAPDENNIDDFRDSVENTIQKLGEYFKNNPENITIAISPDTSMDAMDFQAARQEFLQNMINAFGGNVETLTDEQIKIICEFGFIWDGETKSFKDAYDSMQQIFDQKLYTKVEGGMGGIEKLPFTVNEAAKAYQLLNNAAEDALFTSQELFDRVVTSEYLDSSLSELARQYKNFAEYSDELTESEKTRFNLIKKNLDAWSNRLGEVSGDYDSIIAKIEQIGDLDYSNITPEDFQSQYTDYEDLYSYLVNDFEGAWDIDMLNKVY